MFNEPRQLIIVYKDELALNFMRKLIEINDDKDETIVGTRTRHPMDGDVRGLATKDGKLLCRELINYSTNGGYAAHGHSITAKCAGIFQNLYKNKYAMIEPNTSEKPAKNV